MKKWIVALMLVVGFENMAMASYSYECSRYVNGEWKGYVSVTADNKTEAEYKARLKWEKMDKPVHTVNCK